MELNIEGFDGKTHVVDVDVDDTAKQLRRKVATAVGFAEDTFHMDFGGNGEGEDFNITALSAGDTVVLTQRDYKQEAIAALRALGERDLTPERLARVKDPKVAQLFLQAEVVTVSPNRFLARTKLRSLDLSAPLAITAIGSNFLSRCSSLESINLSGLRNVTRIGKPPSQLLFTYRYCLHIIIHSYYLHPITIYIRIIYLHPLFFAGFW